MPGDRWKQLANLRALYAYMWAHPGKKLLFMGGEIGQWGEWNFESELDWALTKEKDHAGVSKLIRDRNAAYRSHPAMWELCDHPAGFAWIDPNDSAQSVASFVRFPRQPELRVVKTQPSTAALAPPEDAPVEGATGHTPPPRPTKGRHVVFVG